MPVLSSSKRVSFNECSFKLTTFVIKAFERLIKTVGN